MKVFSMSQRIYYKDLEPDAELIIKKDLELYNCMLHKAFKICFDRAYMLIAKLFEYESE